MPESVQSARALFTERFALLYAEAGEPALKQVVESVVRARRVDRMGRPVRVSVQRVSDWRRGRNVPARFTGLEAVLTVLVGQARKRRSRPVAEGLYDLESWQRLWDRALAEPVSDSEDAPADGVCPYPGLAAYRVDQADWFFGRDRAVADLVALLAAEPAGPVLVVGASGAGKSSLLRAGLLPALAGGALPDSGDWPVRVVTPGPDPMRALATEPPERSVLVVDQFEEVFTLCEDTARRDRFLRELGARSAGPTLVVLGLRADFYGHCLDYPELVDASQHRQLVLGPMREAEVREAVTGPARAVGLKLENGLEELLLRDLGVDRDRTGPRADAYDPGALPLLSHALLATWQRRTAGRLTVAGYRAAGGISGSVAATAERAWSGLDPVGRAAARDLLLRLVRVGEDGQDSRRVVSRADLLDAAADPEAAEDVLEALAGARLVTLDDGSVQVTHEALLRVWPRLRGWVDQDRAGALVRQEVDEDAAAWEAAGRDGALLYRGGRLDAAAAVGDVGGLATEYLAAAHRSRRRGKLVRRTAVAAVAAFALVASVSAVMAVRQRDAVVFEQVVGAAERVRESDPSLSAQLDLVAHRLRPEDRGIQLRMAFTQHTPLARGVNGFKGLEMDTVLSGSGNRAAAVIANGLIKVWAIDTAGGAMTGHKILTGGSDRVSRVALSHDGQLLAAVGTESIQLWGIVDVRRPVRFAKLVPKPTPSALQAVFSRDSSTLLLNVGTRNLQAWKVTDPARPRQVQDQLFFGEKDGVKTGPLNTEHGVQSMALSRDGTLLATSTDRIQLRKLAASGKYRIVWESERWAQYIRSIVFDSRDNFLIASSDDGKIRRVSLREDDSFRVLEFDIPGKVDDYILSPDGSILASRVRGGIRLWKFPPGWASPPEVTFLPVPYQGGMAFGADEKSLIVGPVGESFLVFSKIDGGSLPGAGRGARVEFSPTGRHFLVAEKMGKISLWLVNVDGSVSRASYIPGNPLLPTSFGGGEEVLVGDGQGDGLLRWDIRNPENPVLMASPGADGSIVAISPTGKFLVSSRRGSEFCQIFQVSSMRKLEKLPFLSDLKCYGEPKFGARDRLLAVYGGQENVIVFDISDPRKPRGLGNLPGEAYSFVSNSSGSFALVHRDGRHSQFWSLSDSSPPRAVRATLTTASLSVLAVDRDLLLTQDPSGVGHLWDFSGPQALHEWSAVDGKGTSLRLTPDGRTVFGLSDSDMTVHFWDASDPANPVPLSVVLRDTVSAVFAPDGRTVITQNEKTMRVWDLDPTRAAARICASTPGILTPEKWAQHVPGIPYDPPCEADRAAA